jgi:hypothetical protein
MAAVGSVVVTVTPLNSRMVLIEIDWTSSAGGGVSGNPFNVGSGAIQQVAFVPGSGGTQPSNSYGATMVDANSAGDYLAGKGATLSNVTATIGVQAAPLSWVAKGTLDLVIAAAGNAKTGKVFLWQLIDR